MFHTNKYFDYNYRHSKITLLEICKEGKIGILNKLLCNLIDTNKLDNTLRLVGTQFKNLPSGTEVYFNNTIYQSNSTSTPKTWIKIIDINTT